MTDFRLMKGIRKLLAITVVSLVASTAFAGPIHTAAEQVYLDDTAEEEPARFYQLQLVE